MSDLVERARAYVVHVDGQPVNLGDRIEELERERDEAEGARIVNATGLRMQKDRADNLAARLKEAVEALSEIKRLGRLVAHDLNGRVEAGKTAAVRRLADLASDTLARIAAEKENRDE